MSTPARDTSKGLGARQEALLFLMADGLSRSALDVEDEGRGFSEGQARATMRSLEKRKLLDATGFSGGSVRRTFKLTAAGRDAAALLMDDLLRDHTRPALGETVATGHRQHDVHDHHGDRPGSLVMDEAFWDERYRSTSAVWSGKPNPQLVAEVGNLAPGAALDVGCGEGADAIWLAERGWAVTAVDHSRVALERGKAHAQEPGIDVAQRIQWLHADLAQWLPAEGTYDLVSAQFMHLPRQPRDGLFRRLAKSVSPGGTLLIVGHHPTDAQTTAARPPVPELFFTADDVAAPLDPNDWDIIVSEARPRTTLDLEGRTVTIHDTVLRAQRRG